MVLHAKLARTMGVEDDNAIVMVDGDVLSINEQGARLDERVSAEYVYVDGLGVGDVDTVVLRDRLHLATDGMVVVVLTIDKRTGS
jgi:ribonuclease J